MFNLNRLFSRSLSRVALASSKKVTQRPFHVPTTFVVATSNSITQTTSTGVTDGAIDYLTHNLMNLSIDTQLAAVGLLLTVVQFYLADRQSKNERVAKFEDTIGEHMAKLEYLATKMRQMRHGAISVQMIGSEFVTMHQQTQQEIDSTLIEMRNSLRRLGSITVLPDVFYGPGFWNLTRSIERDAALTKWRLFTLVTCNQRIITYKSTLSSENKHNLNTWPEVAQNSSGVRRFADHLEGFISGDAGRIQYALDEDILDTQLAILTNTSINDAQSLIVEKIIPKALNSFHMKNELVDSPTLLRMASFCLRAAAKNTALNNAISDFLKTLYKKTPCADELLAQIGSTQQKNIHKWHAAAKLMCFVASQQQEIGVKTPSAVPDGILGIIHLREAQYCKNNEERTQLLKKSITYLDSAITIGPFRAYYRIYRAHSEYLLSQLDLAYDDVTRALKEDPDNAHGHILYALILLEKNEIALAKKEANWHTRVSENNPFTLCLVYETLAKLHYKLKENGVAEHYKKLLETTYTELYGVKKMSMWHSHMVWSSNSISQKESDEATNEQIMGTVPSDFNSYSY